MDPTLVSVGGLVAVQVVTLAQQFLPDVSHVRKGDTADPAHADFVGAVRSGELATAVGVVVIAGTASAMTRSLAPLAVGAAGLAAMVVLYEALLAYQPKGN